MSDLIDRTENLQPTCNQLATDLISRQAARDTAIAMRKKCDTDNIDDYLDMIVEALEVLPSAQPEQRWIPVSERLPEYETDVLVTRHFLGWEDHWNNNIPPSTYVEVAMLYDDYWRADSDEYKIARSKHTDPIAWMPLPEPYREEGD